MFYDMVIGGKIITHLKLSLSLPDILVISSCCIAIVYAPFLKAHERWFAHDCKSSLEQSSDH